MNTFKCARCQRTFDKGWSDEEAEAELKERFPDREIEECALVCDDCFAILTSSQEQ